MCRLCIAVKVSHSFKMPRMFFYQNLSIKTNAFLGSTFQCRNTYLFVCLLLNVPFETISLTWRHLHCGRGLQILVLCSVLTVIEQGGGILNVPQQLLLWQGPLLLGSHLKYHPHLVSAYWAAILIGIQPLTRGRCTLHCLRNAPSGERLIGILTGNKTKNRSCVYR